MIPISAVSYLNTKPFLLGLQHSSISREISVSLDTPAQTAQRLLSGEAQVGLVPVAVIPQLPHRHLITRYCIGAVGAVQTVCLYSRVPLNQIRRIWLDYQSRTSVQLVQLLCQHYWHINPQFLPATIGFESLIASDTAALVIGDRAISLNAEYEYVYDLGEAWHQWTQLPFVFAAWIANKPLSEDFIASFNAANAAGMQELESIAASYPFPAYDLLQYLTVNVHYLLTKEKRAGMQLFLQCLQQPANASVLVQQATTSILK